MMACAPATAVEIGRLGGLVVISRGCRTYKDPEPLFEEIAKLDDEKATNGCRRSTPHR